MKMINSATYDSIIFTYRPKRDVSGFPFLASLAVRNKIMVVLKRIGRLSG